MDLCKENFSSFLSLCRNGGLIACAVGLVLLAIISNFTVRLLHICKVEYLDGKKPIKSYAGKIVSIEF